ncbi:hypothetical protein [Mesorhizobium temperatum]|uniref:Uncharacterized protein n=1 Tax=Mesorhizobium temperatum TaxID=241416 RepID=A0A271LD78_9HYPH|nr:hypothetical protein [Mesorhizobium temperatum]PAQ06081.1 hypothetical protein CIT26_28280 [Mesorhizobium temperatum]
MFERLEQNFEALRDSLSARNQQSLDAYVGAITRFTGDKLSPRPLPTDGLSTLELAAFEASISALLSILVPGSIGWVPNFGKLYQETLEKLEISGWQPVADELLSNKSAAARASYEVIKTANRCPEILVMPENIEATRESHSKITARLLDQSNKLGTPMLNEVFLQHRDCSGCLMHLRWSDVGSRTYTDFALHSFYDDRFREISRQALLSKIVWRCLRGDYRSSRFFDGFSVTGSIFNGGRDGLGADFIGVETSSSDCEIFTDAGFLLYPLRMSVQLNERML